MAEINGKFFYRYHLKAARGDIADKVALATRATSIDVVYVIRFPSARPLLRTPPNVYSNTIKITPSEARHTVVHCPVPTRTSICSRNPAIRHPSSPTSTPPEFIKKKEPSIKV